MTKGQGLQKEESRKLHFYASQKCSTCEFRICNNCISSNAFDHNLCCLRSQPPAGFANWLEFLRTSRKRSENRRWFFGINYFSGSYNALLTWLSVDSVCSQMNVYNDLKPLEVKASFVTSPANSNTENTWRVHNDLIVMGNTHALSRIRTGKPT